jgi:hypothetical protein
MNAYDYASAVSSGDRQVGAHGCVPASVHGWERIYNNPVLWHLRFHGSTPEALVRKAPLPELR